IALTADDEDTGLSETLPTLDELMAGLNTFQEAASDSLADDSDHGVMLPPELVFEPDDEIDDPRTRPIVPLKRQGERGSDGARDGRNGSDGRDGGERREAATPTAAPVAVLARKSRTPSSAASAPPAPEAEGTPHAPADI